MPGMNGEPTIEELKQYAMLLEKAKEYLRTFGEQIPTEKRMEQQKQFIQITETFRGLPLINGNDEPLNCAVGLLRNSPPTNPHAYTAVQEHLKKAEVQFQHYRTLHRELDMGNIVKSLADFYAGKSS